jgi:hypothetical protein
VLHGQVTGSTSSISQLADLETAATSDYDPSLLDELPYLPGILASAPEPLIENLLAALDLQCLYRKDKNQVTIWVTITDSTPATIAALLADPRTDSEHPGPSRRTQTTPPPRLFWGVGTRTYSASNPSGSWVWFT